MLSVCFKVHWLCCFFDRKNIDYDTGCMCAMYVLIVQMSRDETDDVTGRDDVTSKERQQLPYSVFLDLLSGEMCVRNSQVTGGS